MNMPLTRMLPVGSMPKELGCFCLKSLAVFGQVGLLFAKRENVMYEHTNIRYVML